MGEKPGGVYDDSFNNITAICTAVCYGNHSDDEVKAMLTLYCVDHSQPDKR